MCILFLLFRAVRSHLLASLLSIDDPVDKNVDVELLNVQGSCKQRELNVDVSKFFTKYLLLYTITPV